MNLVIGSTSQLAQYFPEDYIKISSRDIDIQLLKNTQWESVYICFAEQNMKSSKVDFITPNYNLTKDIINLIENYSKKIVVYTTCELWNKHIGEVDTNTAFNYKCLNDYCLSKELLFNWIKQEQLLFNRLKNVIIIHPFNFNSIYRGQNYLFGKIFYSIINKKPIEIGNTYFHRDIVHTKYMVERTLKTTQDEVIGSGRLTNINNFIRDIYNHFEMKYEDWVKEDLSYEPVDRLFYSKQSEIYTYNRLLTDTINDIEKKI